MYYGPVGYVIEYDISALVFLSVIMARYFSARRFPNQKNRMFTLILCTTFVDLIADVLSAIIIDNVFLVPLYVTFLVNIVFYSLQIFLPMLMTAYVFVLSERLSRKKFWRLSPLFLPGLLTLGLLFSTPVTHLFFYVDPELGYVHGIMFLYTYGVCLFYMIATLCVTLRNRSRLRPIEFSSICLFLAVVLLAMLVQFCNPALLISGMAITLSVILMYFTIQNPDTMLDTATGAFTYEAMLAFLHDRVLEQDHVQLAAVKINNVHRINELLGIENGSLLLRQVSQFLLASTNDSWVFRVRGSCFVAITRKPNDYRQLRDRLQRRIGQPWLVGNTELLLQATVCFISAEDLPDRSISPEDAVNYLETAFLQNDRTTELIRTVSVGHELLEQIARSRAVEAALREALEDGEGLEIFFQPIWSVREARFSGAEVLLRFHHPVMGDISPEEFVPIAEVNGLVTAMDELVVRKVCAFIRDNDPCRTLGLDAIEINLSALEFLHRRLPEQLSDIMAQYQVDPGSLYFEITETAATESFELLRECMQDLCDMGCRFALDDFGTGYANISQVIQLPFSMVKLDRSLLFGPEFVLEDMAQMFGRMQRLTVLEGVETQEQAALTDTIQVDYIQGYYYAKPMNKTDFIRFMEDAAHSRPPAAPV